jgi:fibronectin-binding autotransporter adhesin
VAVTSDVVSGSSSTTLNNMHGTLTFAGAGSNFVFNSNFNGAVLANTSGNQTFGGAINGTVQRLSLGGTSTFSSTITGLLQIQGGTAVLTGRGGLSNSEVSLQGGTLVLDNTTTNNNSRINGSIGYQGGNLSILGVNGGSTVETLPTPEFSSGLNTISLTAGNSGGTTTAVINSALVRGSADTGTIDFDGLGSSTQLMITGQSAGAIGPWATVNGTDFATYDATNGVETMSTAGRPSQVSGGTSSSYVLATGPQTTLTAATTVAGVTMNASANLDLGGQNLTLGGWIQNGGSTTISDGTLFAPTAPNVTNPNDNIDFTVNGTLNISANINSYTGAIVKNGAGTLNFTGTEGTSTSRAQFFVNEGTLALDVSAPIQSLESQSTFVVGQSGGAAGSATLSLMGDNQFASSVGVQVQSAGQFLTNGHTATLDFLEMNGGTANLGGGVLNVGGIMTNNTTANGLLSSTGLIENGTINMEPAIASYGNGGGFSVYGQGYQDSLDVSAQVISTGTVTIAGTGTVVLSNSSNSFGNGVLGLVLSGGTVALQNSSAAGSSAQQIEFNGGTLRADSTGDLTLMNPIIGSNVITSGSNIIFAGGYTQSGSSTFVTSDTLTIDGYTITGSSYSAVKAGTGTLVLGGTAVGTATGDFYQQAGTLAFASDDSLPVSLSLIYDGGTFEAVNTAQTVGNALTITQDITFGGSQALTFSAASGNVVSNNTGLASQTVYVTGTGPVTINNLRNTGSTTGMILGGPGTLILSGDPSGFAATTVNAGVLRVNNSDSVGASLGKVTVNSSGTLGGTGIIGGGLTTVTSGGTIDPGNQTDEVGTLKFSAGLTLNSGATLNFDLGNVDGRDQIDITGGIFTAPTIGTVTLNLANSGDFSSGLYTLVTWINSSSAAANDFSLGNVVNGYNYQLNVVGNSLQLTAIATPEPGVLGLLLISGVLLPLLIVSRRDGAPESSRRQN